MTETQRYKMIVEYRGTDYAGWQRQKHAPTIQQAIETAIHKFSGQEITIQGAGRTDAGVHAYGQIFHVDLRPFTKPMTPHDIAKAINAHLRPAPIAILNVEAVDEDFHARFNAKNKLYRYRIISRPAFLAIEQGLAWLYFRPLDTKAMHEAAQILIGEHDFSSFRDGECQAKSPVRTLDKITVTERPYHHGGKEILIDVEAQSFIHHQVRNFAGSLHMVGDGKWTKDDLQAALDAKDRKAGGPTAPAAGLYLMKIDY